MQPGNQRPHLLTSLVNMSLVPRLHGKCIFADTLQMSHACHRFWKCYKTLTFCSLLTRCTIPCACHAKTTLQRPKVARACGVLYTLTWKYALRHNTTCTFSTSQLLKVLRSWGALCILTWKCASRHNGVQVFISHLASWLCTRRFSQPTFRPSGATNHWKNTVFRDLFYHFYLFAHLHLLSSDSFSSLIFFLLPFSSLTLPTSAFWSVHIVGSLTSKHPSITIKWESWLKSADNTNLMVKPLLMSLLLIYAFTIAITVNIPIAICIFWTALIPKY